MARMRRLSILALVLFTFSIAAQETAKPPKEITPEQLWGVLLQGNKTFVAGKLTFDDLKKERDEVKDHQLPPVTVLSCSDSRVPPELVFNQSLGALFVVRAAGNVADDFGIASIEYAILNGYTKLIVVLGHQSCGAVEASLGIGDPTTPSLLRLATRIRASFVDIPYKPNDPAVVKAAVEANTRAAAAQLFAASKTIRDAAAAGQIKVVAAYYELTTGEVRMLD